MKKTKNDIQEMLSLVKRTITTIEEYKIIGILTINEYSIYLNELNRLYETLINVNITDKQFNDAMQNMSSITKQFGCYSINDYLEIVYGKPINDSSRSKGYIDLITSNVRVTKIISYDKSDLSSDEKQLNKLFMISEKDLLSCNLNLECIDLSRIAQKFFKRVYGIRFVVYVPNSKDVLLVEGFVKDDFVVYYDNLYIQETRELICNELNTVTGYEVSIHNEEIIENYLDTVTLKEYLVYSLEEHKTKYKRYLNKVQTYSTVSINDMVNDFFNEDTFMKRLRLVTLLISDTNIQYKYMAYLLYDMLSVHSNDFIPNERSSIYDSLPWKLKKKFTIVMNETIEYTTKLYNYDVDIPFEQQISLLKVNDSTKQKAVSKLKELRSKSDETGSKARQWLEGLLKIPFGVYKEEPILRLFSEIRNEYVEIKKNDCEMEVLEDITFLEIKNDIDTVINKKSELNDTVEDLKQAINIKLSRDKCKRIIEGINKIVKEGKIDKRICHSGKNINDMNSSILSFVEKYSKSQEVINKLIPYVPHYADKEAVIDAYKGIRNRCNKITSSINMVDELLEKSIHGHDNAKRQIKRIIGQWVTGNNSGYCFGFEGPPGVGKCFARDTPIMLYSGEVKLVQDVTTDDILMGDDNTPRNVLSLGNGIETMYTIKQSNAEDYTVNESHILSLKVVRLPVNDNSIIITGKCYNLNDVVDVCVRDYLHLPDTIKYCLHGFRVGVNFKEIEPPISPYSFGYSLVKDSVNNTVIPKVYKCNSRENQLSLLAGIIDKSGMYSKGWNIYYINSTSKVFTEEITFLVRSLGLSIKVKENLIGNRLDTIQYTINIGGICIHEIPVLILPKAKTIVYDDEWLYYRQEMTSSIEVIKKPIDKYFGFQIDGNSRFLLGDFTVTHNTSLAKLGIANCLQDENGVSRPFSFIAIGGSNNASTLNGHNYTYLGSTWGRIVDILMDKKCMNPIIFIDELDKVSKTEYGKEIISIFTHLVDSTQSDTFQDKYFAGIDIDLSKALFIFSYNDASLIDRILLDRIHRIKFSHLTLIDKKVIVRKHILPELYEKVGITNNVLQIDDSVITFIIEEYTQEPGVRKLKELLFEIISEVNLSILHDEDTSIPINLTCDDVKNKYFKERGTVDTTCIHETPRIGIVNGLWANSMGSGGLIPIQAFYFPSNTLMELKLTGLQGDVMKESMNVAKTLAWNLTLKEKQVENIKNYEVTKSQGIHVHCPDGSVPKDGPSAGTAITLAIHSLLNGHPIKNNVAITGEITLFGNVAKIGGLELKILGGIKGGAKEFIIPKSNQTDYLNFLEKYQKTMDLTGYKFYLVETIQEVFKLVY